MLNIINNEILHFVVFTFLVFDNEWSLFKLFDYIFYIVFVDKKLFEIIKRQAWWSLSNKNDNIICVMIFFLKHLSSLKDVKDQSIILVLQRIILNYISIDLINAFNVHLWSWQTNN